MKSLTWHTVKAKLEKEVSIAPLVTFRIGFGLVMLISTIRYWLKGWIASQLIEPKLHFHYFGFDFVGVLPGIGMYVVFVLLTVCSLGIIFGAMYRLSTVIFFVCFTYVELIDITYYLNHYYFVSIASFLLIFLPAHRSFSWDVLKNPSIQLYKVPLWCVGIFKLQIAIVYFYAGLAKINYDWLINALPLAIWLPAKTSIPIIGPIFKYEITAYLFSWAGMLFDTLIIVGLLWRRTRLVSYIAVIIFHSLTGILFQIGIFPLVMILAVTIFFSPAFHESLLSKIKMLYSFRFPTGQVDDSFTTSRITYSLIILFATFQLVFPWRYLLYDGNIFWTEEGYRFAWRVMLMEKAGTATFYIKDGEKGREGAVINHQFLNDHQEKQMAMQPDLILQFAHHLENHFREKGMNDPKVRAEVMVTLNARPAQLLIDPAVDLTEKKNGWKSKDWILKPNFHD